MGVGVMAQDVAAVEAPAESSPTANLTFSVSVRVIDLGVDRRHDNLEVGGQVGGRHRVGRAKRRLAVQRRAGDDPRTALDARHDVLVATAALYQLLSDHFQPPCPSRATRTAARIATSADLWHSTDGTAYATVEIAGHCENVPVRSRRFKAWLTLRFQADKGKAPSTDALSIGQGMAESTALLEGAQHEVCTRVGHADGKVYLDLCDDAWRAVEIDRDGWRIITDPPVKFARPGDAVALPEPAAGGSLEALRPFVNAPEDDWRIMLAWLIGAMAPDGPYPLLALYGEQGSGKSSTARRLREVIDPARTVTRETPRSTRDLAVAARGCRVLVFDNLSWLTAETSDALCRLATGGGLGTRRLYTDDEESTFYAKRPIIVNGIEEVATRGDLLSRSVVLQLPTLDRYRDERTLDAEFATAHPAILGALLDAVSKALARWDATPTPNVRVGDFARWVEASEAVAGFVEAYAENRTEAVEAEVAASAFATALMEFAHDVGTWEGTAADLLSTLTNRTDDHADKGKHWPSNPKAASDRLRRHAPTLRTMGVEVSDRRSHGRKLWSLVAESGQAAGGLAV